MERLNHMLKKKNKTLIVIVFVSIILLIIVICGIRANMPERRLQKQLDLGAQYLSELKYDQAIAVYELALEIDPMSAEAYIGISNAYLGKNEYQNAVDRLYKGYELTGEPSLIEMEAQIYLNWADWLLSAGEFQEAMQILEEGWERTGDTRIRKLIDDEEEKKRQREEEIKRQEESKRRQEQYDSFLKKVDALLKNGDQGGMWEIDHSDEVQQLVESMEEDGLDHILYLNGGDEDAFSGETVAFYNDKGKGRLYYFGGFKNGLRNGRGRIMFYSNHTDFEEYRSFGVFEGEWIDDLVEGIGKYSYSYQRAAWSIEGNFTDDYQNGTMHLKYSIYEGRGAGKTLGADYDVRMGVADVIRTDAADGGVTYVECKDTDDSHSWVYHPDTGQRLGYMGVFSLIDDIEEK